MAENDGFAGEGDWKTAGLVRLMKVMATGLEPGTSFMEDSTDHLATSGQQVLGSHMLAGCPTIASGRPRVESPVVPTLLIQPEERMGGVQRARRARISGGNVHVTRNAPGPTGV